MVSTVDVASWLVTTALSGKLVDASSVVSLVGTFVEVASEVSWPVTVEADSLIKSLTVTWVVLVSDVLSETISVVVTASVEDGISCTTVVETASVEMGSEVVELKSVKASVIAVGVSLDPESVVTGVFVIVVSLGILEVGTDVTVEVFSVTTATVEGSSEDELSEWVLVDDKSVEEFTASDVASEEVVVSWVVVISWVWEELIEAVVVSDKVEDSSLGIEVDSEDVTGDMGSETDCSEVWVSVSSVVEMELVEDWDDGKVSVELEDNSGTVSFDSEVAGETALCSNIFSVTGDCEAGADGTDSIDSSDEVWSLDGSVSIGSASSAEGPAILELMTGTGANADGWDIAAGGAEPTSSLSVGFNTLPVFSLTLDVNCVSPEFFELWIIVGRKPFSSAIYLINEIMILN